LRTVIAKLTPDHILINSLVICLLIARSKVFHVFNHHDPLLPDQLAPEPFQFQFPFPLPLPLLFQPLLLHDQEGLSCGSIALPDPITFALQVNHAGILHITSYVLTHLKSRVGEGGFVNVHPLQVTVAGAVVTV
jgi:hypothetical protein